MDGLINPHAQRAVRSGDPRRQNVQTHHDRAHYPINAEFDFRNLDKPVRAFTGALFDFTGSGTA